MQRILYDLYSLCKTETLSFKATAYTSCVSCKMGKSSYLAIKFVSEANKNILSFSHLHYDVQPNGLFITFFIEKIKIKSVNGNS